MKRRLVDGRCFASIAEEFEMSDRQIKRIVKELVPIVMRQI